MPEGKLDGAGTENIEPIQGIGHFPVTQSTAWSNVRITGSELRGRVTSSRCSRSHRALSSYSMDSAANHLSARPSFLHCSRRSTHVFIFDAKCFAELGDQIGGVTIAGVYL